MKNIFKEYIRVDPRSGAEVSSCLAEAVELAMKEKTNVRLIHNGRNYLINYQKILLTIEDEACVNIEGA